MTNRERINQMTDKELARLIGLWNGGREESESSYEQWLSDPYTGDEEQRREKQLQRARERKKKQ